MSASDGEAVPDRFELVADVFTTVGEPVRAASLFYALYYLVEVEGVAEAAFDFKQLRERWARGFYWYGVASITREMSHLHDRYFIDGKSAELDQSEPEPVVVEHAEELAEAAGLDVDDVLRVFSQVPGLWDIEAEREMARVLGRLQTEFDALTEPAAYVRLIKGMFSAMPNRDKGPDTMRRDDDTGWPHGYNGPAWEGICEHLLRREDLSDTAFVDQSWSIEHNSSRWIDKIGMNIDPTQNAAVVEELGLSRFDDPRAQSVNPSDVDDAVIDILDAARDGPTSRLFDWAVHFDRDVPSVNLRRMRQRLNL